MRPLNATDIPAVATAVPLAIVAAGAAPRVEPRFVTIRCNGETIAASSAVIRKDTLDGPLYLAPRADIAMEKLVADGMVFNELSIWTIRTADGDVLDAAYSSDRPMTGLKVGWIAFAADKVEIDASAALGEEPRRMI